MHHDGPPDDAGVPAQLDQVVLDAHLGLHQLPELDVAEVPDMAVLSITIYLHLVPPPGPRPTSSYGAPWFLPKGL